MRRLEIVRETVEGGDWRSGQVRLVQVSEMDCDRFSSGQR